jgi:DNA repair exonuclease SbcCD nuclease subunit
MTRLLHISDTHLGKRQYSSDVRRDDFTRAFEQTIDFAIEHDVDAVVHTGDLFDSRQPPLPELINSLETLKRLDEAGIPFLAIVGNHDRKMDDQWLDLMEMADAADRLGREPILVGDVALYGIDAVRKPAWNTADFSLEQADGEYTNILCMHQLLTPPVPAVMAEHETVEVLDRVNVDLDGLAVGDYHATESVRIEDTKVWYAGSTERCSTTEKDPRTVSLIDVVDGEIGRRQIELDTREFVQIHIEFGEDDSYGHVESVVDQHDVRGKVVPVHLTGKRTSVSSRDVREAVQERGAAVCRVKDDRGRDDLGSVGGPDGDVQDQQSVIEERLTEADLGEFTLELEEKIRSADVKSGFDDEVTTLVEARQNEVFSGDAAESAEPGDAGTDGEVDG